MLLLVLFATVFGRSSIWGSLDYRGLDVRDWESGLEEAARREMPLMVFFMQENVIDDSAHKLLDFNNDPGYFKRTSKFVVVVADDSDEVCKDLFAEYGLQKEHYPKLAFYHWNGNRYELKDEPKDFWYEDSFDITDAMENVLDLVDAGVVPAAKPKPAPAPEAAPAEPEAKSEV